jgi:hypothetical protein
LCTTDARISAVKALIGGYISPQGGNKSSYTPPDTEYSLDRDRRNYQTKVDHKFNSDEEVHNVVNELKEYKTCLRKVL